MEDERGAGEAQGQGAVSIRAGLMGALRAWGALRVLKGRRSGGRSRIRSRSRSDKCLQVTSKHVAATAGAMPPRLSLRCQGPPAPV
jgi:hypothetical protein